MFADLLAGVDPSLAGAATPAARKGVINLHIGLTTLACLEEHPGEIPGFGQRRFGNLSIADIARQTATQMAQVAQWRFTVNDDNGETVAEGKLRYRPTAARQRPRPHLPGAGLPASRRPLRPGPHHGLGVQPRNNNLEFVLSV